MNIRRATEKDIPKVLDLLQQVLKVHSDLRPDLFIEGTTKYTAEELAEMFRDDTRPVYVGVDVNDEVLGYAFCVVNEPVPSNNLHPHRSIYIDDICVDAEARGQHVATQLFEYVKEEARRLGCYHITLNVWAGNDAAQHFYEVMGMTPKKTEMEYILED